MDISVAKQMACGIIDAMSFTPSREYEFEDGRKYFISGPMSGIDGWNKEAFDRCEKRIRELAGDVMVDNPASEVPRESNSERPHVYYMRGTIQTIVDSYGHERKPLTDAVVLLPNWETSYGAVMEAMVAHECGIDLVLWEEN